MYSKNFQDNYFKIITAINEFCLKGFVINETCCSSNRIPFDMYRKTLKGEDRWWEHLFSNLKVYMKSQYIVHYKQEPNWAVVCSIMVTGHRCLCGRAVRCRCPPSPACLAAHGWHAASWADAGRQKEMSDEKMRNNSLCCCSSRLLASFGTVLTNRRDIDSYFPLSNKDSSSVLTWQILFCILRTKYIYTLVCVLLSLPGLDPILGPFHTYRLLPVHALVEVLKFELALLLSACLSNTMGTFDPLLLKSMTACRPLVGLRPTLHQYPVVQVNAKPLVQVHKWHDDANGARMEEKEDQTKM